MCSSSSSRLLTRNMLCCAVCRSKGEEAAHLWTAALPILYSVFSALIGTQSVLFSKTLAVLLRSTFAGDNQVGVCVWPGKVGVEWHRKHKQHARLNATLWRETPSCRPDVCVLLLLCHIWVSVRS